jgi:hypothetical protein
MAPPSTTSVETIAGNDQTRPIQTSDAAQISKPPVNNDNCDRVVRATPATKAPQIEPALKAENKPPSGPAAA